MGTWNPPLVPLLTLVLVGTPEPPPADHDDRHAVAPVVRVTLALVQVDAVVTDKAGRHITDLTAEDFEIFEDGRAQEITNCAYIAIPKRSTPTPSAPASVPTAAPPPTPLRREEVRRTLALVVDDLGLSFRSTIEVRDTLKRFVNEQMEPGDLVAIVRAGGGMGALQQFTTDKGLLHAAIERVRFNAALSRVGVDPFSPVGEFKNVIDAGGGPRGGKPAAGSAADQLRESVLTDATLASLNFVIKGLGDLPGRKAVVLFSDGLRLFQQAAERLSIAAPGSRSGPGGSSASRSDLARSAPESDPRVEGALGRLIDVANRASVVLYTVDTRGLSTLALNAADDVNTLLGTADVRDSQLRAHADARRLQNFENQEGLRYMAQETGGFLVRNQNDLSKGLERVLDDQRGYYLIGYAPDPSTFKAEGSRSAFHKIKVKVKRPGLDVRSRAGFYGRPDADAPRTPSAGPGVLLLALASPFASGDIHLQLTSLFVHKPQKGSVLRSLLHVDARDLGLRETDGSWRANIEILAVTFGDNGVVVDQIGRPQEISVASEQLDRALQEGLTYTVDVPVKQPGAYQLRVAIRDTSTGRVGSANQLVQVPDLRDKHLALSGILVGSLVTDGALAATTEPEATAALRRFRPGRALSYSFAVYNAQVDRATGRPRLDAQMRLFRDGQPLKVGEVRPIEVGDESDVRMVTSGGALMLGPGMPPGDYVLQVIVTDNVSGKKKATATQAIDFEVRQ